MLYDEDIDNSDIKNVEPDVDANNESTELKSNETKPQIQSIIPDSFNSNAATASEYLSAEKYISFNKNKNPETLPEIETKSCFSNLLLVTPSNNDSSNINKESFGFKSNESKQQNRFIIPVSFNSGASAKSQYLLTEKDTSFNKTDDPETLRNIGTNSSFSILHPVTPSKDESPTYSNKENCGLNSNKTKPHDQSEIHDSFNSDISATSLYLSAEEDISFDKLEITETLPKLKVTRSISNLSSITISDLDSASHENNEKCVLKSNQISQHDQSIIPFSFDANSSDATECFSTEVIAFDKTGDTETLTKFEIKSSCSNPQPFTSTENKTVIPMSNENYGLHSNKISQHYESEMSESFNSDISLSQDSTLSQSLAENVGFDTMTEHEIQSKFEVINSISGNPAEGFGLQSVNVGMSNSLGNLSLIFQSTEIGTSQQIENSNNMDTSSLQFEKSCNLKQAVTLPEGQVLYKTRLLEITRRMRGKAEYINVIKVYLERQERLYDIQAYTISWQKQSVRKQLKWFMDEKENIENPIDFSLLNQRVRYLNSYERVSDIYSNALINITKQFDSQGKIILPENEKFYSDIVKIFQNPTVICSEYAGKFLSYTESTIERANLFQSHGILCKERAEASLSHSETCFSYVEAFQNYAIQFSANTEMFLNHVIQFKADLEEFKFQADILRDYEKDSNDLKERCESFVEDIVETLEKLQKLDM